MKVAVISYMYESLLESKINDFIKNKKVIDIKFSTANGTGTTKYSALIMYK